MSEINLESLYQNTLLKLKNDQRPQIKLTPELIAVLKSNWSESPLKVLCILNHTQSTSAEFNQLIFAALNESKDYKFLIFLLAASEKHIISHSFMTGNMIPMEFFDILKKLLQTKNPELLEWVLRTIESMGPLNRRLQKEIRKSKPGFMKYFNSHLRASDEIIILLEKQWKK
jgi:hypothetical protein